MVLQIFIMDKIIQFSIKFVSPFFLFIQQLLIINSYLLLSYLLLTVIFISTVINSFSVQPQGVAVPQFLPVLVPQRADDLFFYPTFS